MCFVAVRDEKRNLGPFPKLHRAAWQHRSTCSRQSIAVLDRVVAASVDRWVETRRLLHRHPILPLRYRPSGFVGSGLLERGCPKKQQL